MRLLGPAHSPFLGKILFLQGLDHDGIPQASGHPCLLFPHLAVDSLVPLPSEVGEGVRDLGLPGGLVCS